MGLAWGPSPGREAAGFGVSALVVYLQASSELMLSISSVSYGVVNPPHVLIII